MNTQMSLINRQLLLSRTTGKKTQSNATSVTHNTIKLRNIAIITGQIYRHRKKNYHRNEYKRMDLQEKTSMRLIRGCCNLVLLKKKKTKT